MAVKDRKSLNVRGLVSPRLAPAMESNAGLYSGSRAHLTHHAKVGIAVVSLPIVVGIPSFSRSVITSPS